MAKRNAKKNHQNERSLESEEKKGMKKKFEGNTGTDLESNKFSNELFWQITAKIFNIKK